MGGTEERLRIRVSERAGDVSAILLRPEGSRQLLAFAHGAGADMNHPFMQSASEQLARRGVATLRYQFPYSERGARRPSPRPLLLATVGAAIDVAREAAGSLPLLAGGKSMGGRMTSLLAAQAPLPGVRGLVFFGFPLHAAGRPSDERGEHLARLELPMLFLQGTRDRLADPTLLRRLCQRLGPRATLHAVEDGDHSFRVPRRTGRTDSEVIEELAAVLSEWADALR